VQIGSFAEPLVQDMVVTFEDLLVPMVWGDPREPDMLSCNKTERGERIDVRCSTLLYPSVNFQNTAHRLCVLEA
jgi:hypothetical protein